MHAWTRRTLTAALVAWIGFAAASTLAEEAPAQGGATDPRAVTFSTDDGVTIAGRLWLEDSDRPTVVALPMYRNVKESYDPVVPALLKAGCNVLAIDLRGHGESVKKGEDLAARVRDRDAELFAVMNKDAEAAIRYLESQHGVDATRIGLLGASVGCSVAVRTAVKNRGQVRALVLMTPGAAYLGVDTLADLADWDAPPTLILTSTEEEPRVRPVASAISSYDSTEVQVYEGRGIHGTRMFGTVEGVEERIARFFRHHLVEAIDLRIPCFEEGHPLVETPGFVRRTLRARCSSDSSVHELMVFGSGSSLSLGAMVKQPFDGTVVFHLRTAAANGTSRIEVPMHHPRGDREPSKARILRGKRQETAKASAAAAGPWGWVQVDIDRADWRLDEGFELALSFRPDGKDPVVLPSQPAERQTIGDREPERFYAAKLTFHARPEEAVTGGN